MGDQDQSMLDTQTSGDRDFLLDAAAWQDSLLQSYRSLHMTLQSILLAISAGLLVAVISIDSFWGSLAAALVLIVIWLFQRFTTSRFKGIVHSRGEDVNFWHREIILAERPLPPHERHFTRFKVYQKQHRHDADDLVATFLSDQSVAADDVTRLIEKGLGHTRLAVDQQLFERLAWIWRVFVASSILYVAYRAVIELL